MNFKKVSTLRFFKVFNLGYFTHEKKMYEVHIGTILYFF